MMGKITKKKKADKARSATDNTIKDYANDPYFVNKREMASAFLKKVGVPESFKKPQAK